MKRGMRRLEDMEPSPPRQQTSEEAFHLDSLVQTSPISDSFLSDHCTVLSGLTLLMPATTVKEVCYRKTKAIEIESFKDDLRKSRLC